MLHAPKAVLWDWAAPALAGIHVMLPRGAGHITNNQTPALAGIRVMLLTY